MSEPTVESPLLLKAKDAGKLCGWQLCAHFAMHASSGPEFPIKLQAQSCNMFATFLRMRMLLQRLLCTWSYLAFSPGRVDRNLNLP